MTKSKTSNEHPAPADTAGAAMKVAEPTAEYAGNGSQKPEKLVGRSENVPEHGTAVRQQLDGDHLVEQVTENVSKNVSTSNQALYEKFSDELRQQNKEFNEAIQQQNDKFNQAIQQQNDKFNQAIQQQNKEFNEAIQTQNKEFNEAMQRQNDKFNDLVREQNDKFNDKINQIHRDINVNNRWLIGGLIALVIAVLLT